MGQEEAGKSHFIALLVNGERPPSLLPFLLFVVLVVVEQVIINM